MLMSRKSRWGPLKAMPNKESSLWEPQFCIKQDVLCVGNVTHSRIDKFGACWGEPRVVRAFFTTDFFATNKSMITTSSQLLLSLHGKERCSSARVWLVGANDWQSAMGQSPVPTKIGSKMGAPRKNNMGSQNGFEPSSADSKWPISALVALW